MINSDDVAEWCKALKRRFKTFSNQTLQNLADTHYTITDVWTCKSSITYIIFIISAVKQYDQTDTKFAQILHVWTNLDLVLQKIINKSMKKITISQFMNLLLKKQFNWFNHFSHLFWISNTYDSQFCSQSLLFFYKQIEDESFMSAFHSSCDNYSFVSSATVWFRQNEYWQAYMKH